MNKYVIPLEIDKETDLYCPYNTENELDDDVIEYILRKVKGKGRHENIQIRICSREAIDEDRVRGAFERWIKETEGHQKAESRNNQIKQLWMFGIGIGFITLSMILQYHVNTILFTFISTIGAFATWEASSIWFIENPKLQIAKRITNKWMENAEIVFVRNDDASADEGQDVSPEERLIKD